ncbi:MAG TPA: hypothetical protein VIP28_15275 [Nocardioides sp.]
MSDTGHDDDAPTEVLETVPNLMDVRAGFDEVREEMATDRAIVGEFPRHMHRIATSAGTQAGVEAARRTGRRFGMVGLAVALLVSVGSGIAAIIIATSASSTVAEERVARIASEQRDAEESRRTAESLASLQDSNAQLQARGQAPVETPPPSAPDSDALVAATTARVLAALPQSPDMAAIAQMVAAAVAAQPTGPSAAQLSAALADYFRVNPPPRGPAGDAGAKGDMGAQGDRGEPGRPPTAEEIQDAVNAYLAEHPPPKGDTGADGKPPASWTYPDELGGRHTCTRDPGSPDAAATYTCD